MSNKPNMRVRGAVDPPIVVKLDEPMQMNGNGSETTELIFGRKTNTGDLRAYLSRHPDHRIAGTDEIDIDPLELGLICAERIAGLTEEQVNSLSIDEMTRMTEQIAPLLGGGQETGEST